SFQSANKLAEFIPDFISFIQGDSKPPVTTGLRSSQIVTHLLGQFCICMNSSRCPPPEVNGTAFCDCEEQRVQGRIDVQGSIQGLFVDGEESVLNCRSAIVRREV